jgi:hypothetical protein
MIVVIIIRMATITTTRKKRDVIVSEDLVSEPHDIRERMIMDGLYDVVEYMGGHRSNAGKTAGYLKNPKWRCVRKRDGLETIVMYCETDAFCLLCDEAMSKIREHEVNLNDNKKVSWYISGNGYIQGRIGGQAMAIHQIVTGVYGNGKGTSKISIDHIDRDPLNNRMDNLRIADRKMQEQNSKGIAPGTKRERQSIARPLPEGIAQDMMRKYVIYYLNTYNKEKGLTREYFTVENPVLERTWESSKSKDVSIMDKLAAANKVAADLEKGIFPTKAEKPLPKYFRYGIRNGIPSIVFERRTADTRCALDYSIPADEHIGVSLGKMREKIIAKYGDVIA